MRDYKNYNWKRLNHMDGTATDTPEQLENFFSADENRQFQGRNHLFDKVVYLQQDIFTVTPVVVKIFIDALLDPTHDAHTNNRIQEILFFLGDAGSGLAMQIEFRGDADPIPAPTPEELEELYKACEADENEWYTGSMDYLMDKAQDDMFAMIDDVIKAVSPFAESEDTTTQEYAIKAIEAWEESKDA